MATSQINARLDTDVKRAGDATLARFGANATQAIRSLWTYMAETNSLPNFMDAQEQDAAHADPKPLSPSDGAGLALRLAQEQGLSSSDVRSVSYEELRDLAFDELVREGKARV